VDPHGEGRYDRAPVRTGGAKETMAMLDSFRFQRRLAVSAAASCMLLAAAACGGGGNTGAGGGTSGTTGTTSHSTTTLGTGGSTGTGGTGGVGPTCDDAPGYGGAGTALTVASGTAVITDLQGAPVKQNHIELCGTNICFTGQTSDAGSVTVSPNASMKKPTWKFGDAKTYARLAVPITQATTDLGTLTTAALPTGSDLLAGGKDVTSGGVTLSIPSPVSMSFADLTIGYDSPDTEPFRAVSIPIDKESAVLGPTGQTPALLFGVAPAETVFCPAVKVTVAIPDSAKAALPADADVEFWVLGLDTGQSYAPYGAWQKISDGKVSADGATVSTIDGGGFPFLESFFIVKKP
jgi:hypothetical protein